MKEFIGGILVGIFIEFLIAVCIAMPKSEIVKHGAAHWTVDVNGNTAFVWNDEEKK